MIRTNAARGCRLGWLLLTTAMLGCGGGGGSSGTQQPTNHSPIVSASATPSPVVMGQPTQLSAAASDADGDPLSYSWTQTSPGSPQGSFGTPNSKSTDWTAPTVSAATQFTLTVTVSDGRGGTAAANVKVFTKSSADLSFAAEVQPVFDTHCTGACHNGPTSAAGFLQLTAAESYAALVNVPAAVTCSGQLRVKPGDPDSSVLLETMVGTSCGNRMPFDTPQYFDSAPTQLAAVRSWILQGAPNN